MTQYQHYIRGGRGLVMLALLLITGGVFYFLCAGAIYAVPSRTINILAPQQKPITAIPNVENMPIHLSIPTLGIGLSVSKGSFDGKTGQWTIDNKHAFFTNSTATPLFYGHNQPHIFAGLANIKRGSIATIEYQDGTSINFVYDKTQFVEPDDARVLTEKNSHTIMLLTCDGFFNELRRIVYFKEII